MREVCLSWPGWSCERLPADGAAVWRLDGWPPEPAFSLTPEEESVEVLFCREGEASLKLAAGQRVSLGPGQVLFLTGRDAGSLCRFSPEYFRGILE